MRDELVDAPLGSSVGERVYQSLRRRILIGELPHGARLHQEALSEELGVSRTPLREALGRLAADGLVELLPQRGARVTEVRPEDMAAAYEARLALEPAAAALAAGRCDDDDRRAMTAAIAAHRAAADDMAAAFDANRAFHLALVRAARNSYLLRFAEALWAGRVGLAVYVAQREPPEFIRADADCHEAIATAVAEGRAEDAERLMAEHIATARDLLAGQLGHSAAAP